MPNKLFALVGPSGVGKDAIIKAVVKKLPQIRKSVSFTTRKPRRNEKNYRDYFFVSPEKFRELIKNGKLLEYEEVHPGLYYGTPSQETRQLLEQGSLIKAIDVLGAQSLKKAFPGRVCAIFIKPPSFQELKSRIQKRGGLSPQEIKERLGRLSFEMRRAHLADYQVLNEDFSDCVGKVVQIIQTELNKKPSFGFARDDFLS